MEKSIITQPIQWGASYMTDEITNSSIIDRAGRSHGPQNNSPEMHLWDDHYFMLHAKVVLEPWCAQNGLESMFAEH